MLNRIRIATRKSPLALWQANFIADSIKILHPNCDVVLVPMMTSGDAFTKNKLQEIGGKGLFVKELEEALLAKKADIAVHSMKDVPAIQPDGLHIPVICQRDNPLDMLVSRDHHRITALPKYALIGTASLRRQSQLLALRPDLKIKSLRGNIHTRLQKLVDENFDAIVLAAAGLERMNINQYNQSPIPSDVMLPACGQGALGIECRIDDPFLLAMLQPLNDALTTQCVLAERKVNAELGGNCHVPLAVYARMVAPETMQLQAKVLAIDGRICIEDTQTGPLSDWQKLAHHCSVNLLAKGAQQLLAQVY